MTVWFCSDVGLTHQKLSKIGIQVPRCPTTSLLQSLNDGFISLYADLNFCPGQLIRYTVQVILGLLQVGLSSLKIDRQKEIRPKDSQKALPEVKTLQLFVQIKNMIAQDGFISRLTKRI